MCWHWTSFILFVILFLLSCFVILFLFCYPVLLTLLTFIALVMQWMMLCLFAVRRVLTHMVSRQMIKKWRWIIKHLCSCSRMFWSGSIVTSYEVDDMKKTKIESKYLTLFKQWTKLWLLQMLGEQYLLCTQNRRTPLLFLGFGEAKLLNFHIFCKANDNRIIHQTLNLTTQTILMYDLT